MFIDHFLLAGDFVVTGNAQNPLPGHGVLPTKPDAGSALPEHERPRVFQEGPCQDL